MGKLFHARSKNRESSVEGYRNVATVVEEKVDAFLSLYATYLGVTKANLFRSMINEWYERCETDEYKMIDHLASEAYEELDVRLKNRMKWETVASVVSGLKEEISNTAKRSKRGLYDYQIKKIIKRLDEKRKEQEEHEKRQEEGN